MRICNRLMSHVAGLAATVLLLAGPARADFDDHLYSSGHADIGVEYAGGSSFRLFYEFGPEAVIDGTPNGNPPRIPDLDPGDATVIVPDAAQLTAPGGGIPFLSVTSGDPVWILPQSNSPGLPFLGFAATEELEPSDWATPVTFTLTGFSGPSGGQFAVWQTGSFGGTTVFMQTNDGIGVADAVSKAAGVHDHFNLGFSAPGVYDITVTAAATHADGTAVSGTGTFRFRVGTVVPEPSSLALAATGLGGLTLAWARRRGRKPVTTR